MNQLCESEKIHFEMKDEKLFDNSKTWKEALLEDFNVFAEKGITHPDMEKIKTLLEIGQLSPECAASIENSSD